MLPVVTQSNLIGIDTAHAVPKYANIAIATANEIVAAVASNKIRVLAAFVLAAGDVDAYWADDTPTAICGDGSNGIDLTANSGFVLPFNQAGWFETASGQALDLTLGGAVRVAGCITYILVP